jgi:hypothetical protein
MQFSTALLLLFSFFFLLYISDALISLHGKDFRQAVSTGSGMLIFFPFAIENPTDDQLVINDVLNQLRRTALWWGGLHPLINQIQRVDGRRRMQQFKYDLEKNKSLLSVLCRRILYDSRQLCSSCS